MNRPETSTAPARPRLRTGYARMHVSPGARRSAAIGLRAEVVFSKREAITSLGAHVVGPKLDEACAATKGTWWFLRHASGWHLHIDGVDQARVALVLTTLVQRRVLWDWAATGTCAPGLAGPGALTMSCDRVALGAGLDLHRADSRGALAYLRQLDRLPETGRPLLRTGHVLGVLSRTVCRAAGLDDATSADILDALACRNANGCDETPQARAHGLAEVLTLLWQVPASRALGGAITPWATGIVIAARSLAAASRMSGLPHAERSAHLRDQLCLVLAAQWDRLGLTEIDQTILAVATRDALRRRAS